MRNPNKDFDAIVWKPKNRFLKRLVAHYVDYVEILGYVFALVLLGIIIAVWTVKTGITKTADGDWKKLERCLLPETWPASFGEAGTVAAFLVRPGDSVALGAPLAVVRREGGNGLDTLVSPAAGIVYWPKDRKRAAPAPAAAPGAPADSGLAPTAAALPPPHRDPALAVPGLSFKAGEPLFEIVDFTRYRVKVRFRGAGVDSIGRNDSAVITLLPPDPKTAVFLDLKTPAGSKTRWLSDAVPADFEAALKKSLEGLDVTAKEQGVFQVKEAEELTFTVTAEGVPAPGAEGTVLQTLADIRLVGALDSGTHILKVELLKGLPPQTRTLLENWGKEQLGGMNIRVGEEVYRLPQGAEMKVKALVRCTTGIDMPLPFAKRPKNLNESFTKERSFEGSLKVTAVPPLLRAEIRRLYEMETPQFLRLNAVLTTHKISWGKRLIGSGKSPGGGGE